MTLLPAQRRERPKVILVHPNGERQTFTCDREDPLWWRDDNGSLNARGRLVHRIELFMARQANDG